MKKIISIVLLVVVSFYIYSNTHFSKAAEWKEGNDKKYENAVFKIVEKNNRWGLKIEGIEKVDSTYFGIYFTNTSEVPTIEELGKATFSGLSYNSKENCYEIASSAYIDSYVQSSDDLYAWAYTKNLLDYTVTLVAQSGKLEKPEFEKYSSAFNKRSGMSNTLTNVLFDNMGSLNGRKFNLKIGRITDVNTLIQLKNDNGEAWSGLLKNVPTDSVDVVYNDVVSLDKILDSIVFNGYSSSAMGSTIIIEDALNKLADLGYYYVYVDFDDEDGKYRPIECVTVARAFVDKDKESWRLDFFNCNGEFSWDSVPDNVEEEKKDSNSNESQNEEKSDSNVESGAESKKDETAANTNIPDTGEKIKMLLGGILLIVLFTISIKKYRNLKI